MFFLENHCLLAVLGTEKMKLAVLDFEGVRVLEGLNDFLLRRFVRGGVLQMSLEVIAPLDRAVRGDLEVTDVAVTVREGHGIVLPAELEGIFEQLVLNLDEFP